MSAIGGTKGWIVLSAVAVLAAMLLVPTVAGTASASPAPQSTATPSNPWAYGGEGYSNGSITIGPSTLTWNATFGWTVIFTETNTSATVYQLEEQRTVGVGITSTYTGPNTTASYSYHGQEIDTAFVNVTDAATVYEHGVAAPAIGILNDSLAIAAGIAESIAITHGTASRSASLDVNGTLHTMAAFAPALGLIPLNLTGVSTWNATSNLTQSGAWTLSWAWTNDGFFNNTSSGSNSTGGNESVSGPVHLTGYVADQSWPVPVFQDHKNRTSILLVIEGPRGNYALYDGFILSPPGFGLFGGGVHPFDGQALGSASISGQAIYVSQGPRGPQITAGATSFTGVDSSIGSPLGGSNPAASSSGPSGTVQGAPMTVPAAQAENACLTSGCGGAAAAGPLSSGLVLVIVAVAVVASVGLVSAIGWRSYARRRTGSNGGFPGTGPNGVPPTAPGQPPRQN